MTHPRDKTQAESLPCPRAGDKLSQYLIHVPATVPAPKVCSSGFPQEIRVMRQEQMSPPPAQNDSDSHNKRTLLENVITQKLSAHRVGVGVSAQESSWGLRRHQPRQSQGRGRNRYRRLRGPRSPFKNHQRGFNLVMETPLHTLRPASG